MGAQAGEPRASAARHTIGPTLKLLITGGSGYLGQALLKRSPQNWELAATHHAHDLEQPGAAAFRVDVRDAAAVAQVMQGFRPDAVLHTAALMSGPAMLAVNEHGSRNVAAACRRLNARLIHLSSDVIFDGEHAPYDEDSSPAPISLYGESKARAEKAIAEEDPEALVVRTSLIYGFDPPDPRTRQVIAGEMPVLFTDEYRCPIFVDDLADALLELAAGGADGVPGRRAAPARLNVAGPDRLSRYEFGIKLIRVFGSAQRFRGDVSASHPVPRPRDCALDITLARRVLKTRLRSVDEVLTTVR